MGVAIPQVITSDRASSAQVIDGSLKFDHDAAQYLRKTFGSAGNRDVWTWSSWVKRGAIDAQLAIFSAHTANNNAGYGLIYLNQNSSDATFNFNNWDGGSNAAETSAVLRDTNGWYHLLVQHDENASPKAKLYINGQLQTLSSNLSTSTGISNNIEHRIGHEVYNNRKPFDGSMSQVYFIDGQSLGPEYFGFTDPLTNTWKPKKYVNTTASHGDAAGVVGFGTNGFYLPFDGSAPIGQDQSGQGNNWTPVNFGGSVELDSPLVTGARPILNTTPGGTQAGVGVFGSKQNVGYAVTVYDDGGGNKYYIDGVKQATLTGLIRGATYTFDTSDSTVSSHPFRFSESDGGSEYTNGVAAITGAATTITIPYNASNELYYYCTSHSGMGSSITGITTNEKLADQYASNCVLAIPLTDGDVTDVSPSIACTSTKKTLTKLGDPTSSSTSFNFYSSSTDFDGTGDYYKSASQSEFAFGTGDFTIEYWIDSDDLAGNQYGHLQISSSSTGLQENYTAGLAIYESPTSGAIAVPGLTSISIPSTGRLIKGGVWNHIALVREGTNARIYINGFLADSSTDSKDVTGTYLGVGGYYNTSYLYNGRMQDLRIYKGVAKYNGSFEVPVTSPAILPDTPSGVSGSSKFTKITDGAVSFDGTDDFLTLANTTDVNFGSGEFTWECFAYFHTVSGSISLMGQWENSTNRRSWLLQLNDGKMQSYLSSTGNAGGDAKQADSPANYINAKRWYHIAVTRSGDDMNLFIDGELLTTTDLTSFSAYANTDDGFAIGAQKASGSAFMNGYISNVRILKGTALYTKNFTPPTAPLTDVTNTKLLCCQSNSEGPQKTAVISSATGTATAMWPLDSDINDDSGNDNTLTENGGSTSFVSAGTNPFGLSNCVDFAADGKYLSYAVTPASAWTIDGYIKFDDVSSGSNSYVLGWNGTDGSDTTIGLTKSNSTFTVWGSSNLTTTTVAETGRWYHVRLTTNGTSDLALYVDGVLARRSTASDGSPASPITIGDMQSGRFNGQIAGVRYTPTDLGAPPLGGETTSSGVTSNSPSVGVSLSGDVAASNFNPFNTDINTVRGQETVYATLSPINNKNVTLSNGNLESTRSSDAARAHSTISVSSGKWFAEMISGQDSMAGISLASQNPTTYPGGDANSYGYQRGGNKYNNGTSSSYGSSFTTNDVIGVALDLDEGTLTFYKNGISQGIAYNNLSGTFAFAGRGGQSSTLEKWNFGQKPFKYAPPDGFQPINAANNRPVKVISRPKDYVGVATYDGSGNTFQEINVGFKPDFVWCKCVEAGENHALFDSVRGPTKILRSDSTDNQYNIAAGTPISFGPNGFIFTNGSGEINESGRAYVGLAWRAGGAPTADNTQTSGAMTANSVSIDGVLQSAYTPSGSPSTYPKRMSVGTDQGFSIVQFVGNASNRTLPHGLGKAPKFMIFKNMDTDATGWSVYHDAIGTATNNYIELQVTTAAAQDDTAFQDTAPTSDVFSIGTKAAVNNDTDDTIAYIWADVPGMQKFGSFTGNSSADGVYVELGFKPAILLVKNYDNTGDWIIWDAARNPVNPVDRQIWPYTTSGTYGAYDQVASSYPLDFLSNGFKMRTTDADMNDSGRNYIYAAWAEAPSVDLYGGGANAR